jgi:fibronectin type 3 domain-containing protein
MKRGTTQYIIRKTVILGLWVFLFFTAGSLIAQEAPVLYLLTDGEEVHIILENTPPETAGFEAFRRGPGDDAFLPLTVEPIRPVDDPHRAYELMGDDASWLAREFDTADPVRLWRKILRNRNFAYTYSMISPGLRMALGRTLIDRSVEPQKRYRYRIDLIDRRGDVVDTVYERIRVQKPRGTAPPKAVRAEDSKGAFEIEWDYPSYRGESDPAVGFLVYRREEGKEPVRIHRAPKLRIEGYLSHFDRSPREGLTYRYGVRAVNLIGRLSPIVYSEPVQIKDSTAPLVPMGLTAVDKEEGVLLLWNISPERDAASYRLYRSSSLEGEYERINREPIPVDSPSYTDGEIRRGVPWFYKVSAIDRAGNESPKCGAVTLIPSDTEPPGPVSGIDYTVDGEKRYVELRWEPSPEGDLSGYHLYRKRNEGSYTRITGTPIEAGSKPAYQDSGFRKAGLRPGDEYEYAVSAVDRSGNEGERTRVTVLIPDLVPPSPVFSFSARPTEKGGVELRWQPSLSKDLQYHRLYRSKEKGKAELAAELAKGETVYHDSDVERGESYEYYVIEVDEAGNESDPSRRRNVVPVDIVPPGAPEKLEFTRHRRGIILRWEAPEDEDIAGYRIYRADYPGASSRRLSGELVAEAEYHVRRNYEGAVYTVTAVDSSANEGDGVSLRVHAASAGGGESR